MAKDTPKVLLAYPARDIKAQRTLVYVQKRGEYSAEPFVFFGSIQEMNHFLVHPMSPFSHLALEWHYEISGCYLSYILTMQEMIENFRISSYTYTIPEGPYENIIMMDLKPLEPVE